jgi:hypothetical protein
VSTLPADLSAALTPAADASAVAWWDGLSADEKGQLAFLCDPQRDQRFFDPDPEGGEPPTVRGGRFIPHDDAWGLEEWGPDWFDYLMEHPEWIELMQPRQFEQGGVCTLHPTARAALAAGHIPADFNCPFPSTDCPMRKLLAAADGRSVRLVGRVAPDGTRRVLALPVL